MKRLVVILTVFFGVLAFSPLVKASDIYEEQRDIWYGEIYNDVDSRTEELLGDIGINGIDADEILNISPRKVFSMFGNIITGEAAIPVSAFSGVLALLMLTALIGAFLPCSEQIKELCETVGTLCVMFAVILPAFDVLSAALSSVKLTEDFILSLLPAFCGVVAFSGSPSLALSFNTVMLGFAETVSVGIAEYIPPLSAFGTAVSAASVLDPFFDLTAIVKMLNKIVNVILAFVSTVFVAVLGIKGGIAGAVDTVGLKGLKFIIGNSVPVVGSAIGDALNTLTAGLGLIKNTAGIFCVIVIVLINVPSLITLFIWKICLCILSFCAQLLGNSKADGFITAINGMFGIITAVICFNMFVFVTGIITVLITGRGM